MKILADEKVKSFTEDDDAEVVFKDLDEIDQKKQVKKYITKKLNAKTNEYLVYQSDFDEFSNIYDVYNNFIVWLKSKI